MRKRKRKERWRDGWRNIYREERFLKLIFNREGKDFRGKGLAKTFSNHV